MQPAGPIRHLAAILHADGVGFSRMMAEDEAAAHRLVARRIGDLRNGVAAAGGRVVNTAGDALLAEFASVVAAVDCAAAFQALPDQGLPFRIGINLGEVIVDGDDIFGDGINVAARLQAAAAPGGVLLSQSAVDQLRGRTTHGFRSLGEKRLKNIPEPVRVYALGGTVRQRRHFPWRLALALPLLALAFLAALWSFWPAPAPRRDGPIPTVAVLPFSNLSGDPAQDYFGNGITEDVIAALGRFRELRVTAKSAVQPMKGRSAEEAARALGVRYLVEGSVRRAGERVRVAAQLVDADTRRQLWSDRWDGEVKDVFAVQDEIVHRIASSLVAHLNLAERERATAKPPANLEAYDIVLRGRAMLDGTRAGNASAREMFELAIRTDAKFAVAYVALADAIYETVVSGWSEFRSEDLDRVVTLAREALTLDPGAAGARRTLALANFGRGDFEAALREAEQALQLNPSDSESVSIQGTVLMWTGSASDAVRLLESAIKSNPGLTLAYMNLGLAYYLSSRHEDAARVLSQALDRRPNPLVKVFSNVVLAAAEAHRGRTVEAARAVAVVRQLAPFFDGEIFLQQFVSPIDRARMAEGLEKAGLLYPER